MVGVPPMSADRMPELALADAIVEEIKPLLAGRGAEVQGAVLVNLVAIFIAGHDPVIREKILQLHIEAVRGLADVISREDQDVDR